jgi:antitoxin component HigA of HigAB toxin-antitoxin module
MTTEPLKNIPTKELADCLGKTIGFASQIKNGHRKLPIKYCASVSRRFGIPLKDLRKDISKHFEE